MDEPAGLYIHIPFCIRKCSYCDFYSITDRAHINEYVNALKLEIETRKDHAPPVDTIYFGGGTPSLLSPRHVGDILGAVYRCCKVAEDAEITLEANPGTVNFNRFREWRVMGINRLNIGVQSFSDRILKFLGRIHDAQESEKALDDAAIAGFDNIGVDLIYGLPDALFPDMQHELDRLSPYIPDHISCYMLTLEPGTPLHDAWRAGKFHLPSESSLCDQYMNTVDFLERYGYHQYEISNFVRNPSPTRNRTSLKPAIRKYSRHNRKYWNHTPYLGFGAAAHSFDGETRSWNCSSVDGYIRDMGNGVLPVEAMERLDRDQLMGEMVYLSLRMTEGLDIDAFDRRFDVDFMERYRDILDELISAESAYIEGSRLKLTMKGMLLHEGISALMF